MTNEYFLTEFCNDADVLFDTVIDRVEYQDYMSADNVGTHTIRANRLLGKQLISIDNYTKLIPQ